MENETEYFTTETPKYLFKEKTISSYDVHFDVKNVKCHKWDIASGAVDYTGWLWWINNQYDNLCEA